MADQRRLDGWSLDTTISGAGAELLASPAFDGCRDLIGGSGELASARVIILNYQLGDPIIRSNETTFQGRKPISLVTAPPSDHLRLPDIMDDGIGKPAAVAFDLLSNPLFVVLSGNVEIHTPAFEPYHWTNTPRTPIPLAMLGPGSVFGVFEFDDRPTARTGWTSSVADATAGWRTAVCLSKFGNDEVRKELAPRAEQSPDYDAGGILRETFRGFKLSYSTRIAILPRETVLLLFEHNIRFLRNSYQSLFESLRLHFSLSPLGNGMFGCDSMGTGGVGKRAESKNRKVEFANMFREQIASRLLRGELTSLIPCTSIEALRPWWKKFNEEAGLVGRGVRLPAIFYVAAMGASVLRVGQAGPNHFVNGPMLSDEMLRLYTLGSISHDELDSVKRIKANPDDSEKEELKLFFQAVVREHWTDRGLGPKTKAPQVFNNRLYRILTARATDVVHQVRSLPTSSGIFDEPLVP